jgi:RHS repeat-associated protein
VVARLLADGSTQLSQFEYNGLGRTTKTIDPMGRVMGYVYGSNQIDLLEIRQQTGINNELQRKLSYNTLHLPLTDTDAAGQQTTYTYNTQGQVLTRTNAKNEMTTYAYGDGTAGHPLGYLRSVTSPTFNGNWAMTLFDYDSSNRVHIVTDSDGYAVTTDYDNLDRKTKVTYPDATYEEFRYTDNDTGVMRLDLTASRDRRGLWTYRKYDGNQHMVSIKDPANRTTQYGWCTCGALTSMTDPKNQTTTFSHDIQSRLYQKVFADGTTVDYLHEGQSAANTVGATSRLKSSTDAMNRRTNYAYFADDSVQQVSYTTTSGQPLSPPTPSLNYTYDSNYKRISTMSDGTGLTTYGYNPVSIPPGLGAGRLSTIDGPLANDTLSFGYDQLGRTTSQSIRHAAGNLYLAPFRAYDPTIGRWISRDPIAEKGGLNLYAYVRNDPADHIDPLGLFPRGFWNYGRCCNKSGKLEFASVAGIGWVPLLSGQCIGDYFEDGKDCEGMTCGGGFYYVSGLTTGTCNTPGCDRSPFSHRRWTNEPATSDPGAKSPTERGMGGYGDTPPGYQYGPRPKP